MVEVLREDKVVHIRLNRPQVRNAWNPEMIRELISAFGSITGDSIHAVVIRGNGGTFSSGADLNWLKNSGRLSFEENLSENRMISDLMEACRNIPVPLISVAEGAVYGGALGIISLSDWVLAENKTKFCFSEARLGIAPAIIMPYVLRRIPLVIARQLMYTAKVFNAHEALEAGLADFTGTEVELDAELNSLLDVLKALPTQALSEIKRLSDRITGVMQEEIREMTLRSLARLKGSEEAQKRLDGFLHK
jgi:methylglutaconyl-CoA hydratase